MFGTRIIAVGVEHQHALDFEEDEEDEDEGIMSGLTPTATCHLFPALMELANYSQNKHLDSPGRRRRRGGVLGLEPYSPAAQQRAVHSYAGGALPPVGTASGRAQQPMELWEEQLPGRSRSQNFPSDRARSNAGMAVLCSSRPIRRFRTELSPETRPAEDELTALARSKSAILDTTSRLMVSADQPPARSSGLPRISPSEGLRNLGSPNTTAAPEEREGARRTSFLNAGHEQPPESSRRKSFLNNLPSDQLLLRSNTNTRIMAEFEQEAPRRKSFLNVSSNEQPPETRRKSFLNNPAGGELPRNPSSRNMAEYDQESTTRRKSFLNVSSNDQTQGNTRRKSFLNVTGDPEAVPPRRKSLLSNEPPYSPSSRQASQRFTAAMMAEAAASIHTSHTSQSGVTAGQLPSLGPWPPSSKFLHPGVSFLTDTFVHPVPPEPPSAAPFRRQSMLMLQPADSPTGSPGAMGSRRQSTLLQPADYSPVGSPGAMMVGRSDSGGYGLYRPSLSGGLSLTPRQSGNGNGFGLYRPSASGRQGSMLSSSQLQHLQQQ